MIMMYYVRVFIFFFSLILDTLLCILNVKITYIKYLYEMGNLSFLFLWPYSNLFLIR